MWNKECQENRWIYVQCQFLLNVTFFKKCHIYVNNISKLHHTEKSREIAHQDKLHGTTPMKENCRKLHLGRWNRQHNNWTFQLPPWLAGKTYQQSCVVSHGVSREWHHTGCCSLSGGETIHEITTHVASRWRNPKRWHTKRNYKIHPHQRNFVEKSLACRHKLA